MRLLDMLMMLLVRLKNLMDQNSIQRQCSAQGKFLVTVASPSSVFWQLSVKKSGIDIPEICIALKCASNSKNKKAIVG